MWVDVDNLIKFDIQIMSMCNGNFCGFSMNERICLFDKFGLFIFYFFKIYFYNLYFYKVGKLDGIKMKCNV